MNVIDKDGNVFSATPSGAWLPAVVAGDTGVLLGQRMQSFLLEAGHPNVIEPGKRPRVTLSPTLVMKDGKPFLILSTPGGDNQDQSLVQVLMNIIEYGMNVQEAVEAPRFQTLHFVSSFDDHRFNPGVLNLEDRIGKDIATALASRGHKVEIRRGVEQSVCADCDYAQTGFRRDRSRRRPATWPVCNRVVTNRNSCLEKGREIDDNARLEYISLRT